MWITRLNFLFYSSTRGASKLYRVKKRHRKYDRTTGLETGFNRICKRLFQRLRGKCDAYFYDCNQTVSLIIDRNAFIRKRLSNVDYYVDR